MARKKIKSAKDVIGAICRTFDILEIVACHDSSIRITEISRKAELPKSAVHRILSTLVSLGYIRQDKDTKKYDIGPKASYLANILERKMNLSFQARPFLIELVERCKETVNLGILDWSKVLYLDTIEGPQAMRMASQKGVRAFLHSTSLGKVLMACLPDQKINEIIREEGLPQFTNNTITDPKRLKSQLKLIKKCGYAVNKEEDNLGAACVAAPIRNYAGQVVAGVSIVGPTTRILNRIEKLSKLVIETTNLISKKLGYESR